MENLIKTTVPSLSGTEKAAILLAEIGPMYNSNYNLLWNSLNLSDAEVSKLMKAMKSLSPYSPAKIPYDEGMNQILREQSVLQEVLDYGSIKGIYTKPEPKAVPQETSKSQKVSDLKDMVGQNPADIANVLKSWLSDE